MFTSQPISNSSALSRSSKSIANRGFTLLELVIAMTILALLSGMVFSIVRGSMKTAFDMQMIQKENDQVSRFIALCRQTFQRLPSTAIITIKTTQAGEPVMQELTISGAPETFAFGSTPMSYKDTIIGLRPDATATENSETHTPIFYIGLSREDLIPKDASSGASVSRSSGEGMAAPDDQGRVWMPLLPDVASLTWRAYKEAEDTWEDEWDNPTFPALIEMNLMLQGHSQPTRMVFALPTTKLTAANAALAPKKPATTTATGSQAGGAAANQGRGGAPGQQGKNQKGNQKGGPPAPGGGGPPGGGRGQRGPGGPGRGQGGGAPQGGAPGGGRSSGAQPSGNAGGSSAGGGGKAK
jgi:prepilin-type N-terminal cleavage/methylation domain-containing protein